MTLTAKQARSKNLIFIALIACVFVPVLDVGLKSLRVYWPEIFTSPLDASNVAELCGTLEINPNDSRCSKAAMVYAFQFFPEIRERYVQKTPRQTVDQELGAYLEDCKVQRTLSDGGYSACYYDLKGDGAYIVEIDYAYRYELEQDVEKGRRLEEAIWKVCTPAVYGISDNWGISRICN